MSSYILWATDEENMIPYIPKQGKTILITTKHSLVTIKFANVTQLIPVSLLRESDNLKIMYVDESDNNIFRQCVIVNELCQQMDDSDITIGCSTDEQLKMFANASIPNEKGSKKAIKLQAIRLEDPHYDMKHEKNDEKPKRKSRVGRPASIPVVPMNPPVNFDESHVTTGRIPQSKTDILEALDIDPKYWDGIIAAAQEASDCEIGFEVQLKVKLAIIEEGVDIPELMKKIKPFYKKLRK